MIKYPMFLCLLYVVIGGVMSKSLHTLSCYVQFKYFKSLFLRPLIYGLNLVTITFSAPDFLFG